MNTILGAGTGRKNVVLGIGLFLLLGVGLGIPLTIAFFGFSVLTADQYQVWKVVHGYGVFIAFINYFFGQSIDRVSLSKQQKELSSYSFLVAGLVGGAGRMLLVLLSAYASLGLYVLLVETALMVLGASLFVLGQMRARAELDSYRARNVGDATVSLMGQQD